MNVYVTERFASIIKGLSSSFTNETNKLAYLSRVTLFILVLYLRTSPEPTEVEKWSNTRIAISSVTNTAVREYATD